jgi:hypothetical protein
MNILSENLEMLESDPLLENPENSAEQHPEEFAALVFSILTVRRRELLITMSS